jgi:hypothetical protein
MTDGERDLHRLIIVFVLRAHVVRVVGGIDHQAQLPLALFLVAVDADVYFAGAALFANHRRSIDVGAGVAFVDRQDRQEIEVGSVAFENDFLARRVLGRNFPDRHRAVLAVRQIFDHLRYRR